MSKEKELKEVKVMCHYDDYEDDVENVSYDLENITEDWSEEDEVMRVLSKFMICPDEIEII